MQRVREHRSKQLVSACSKMSVREGRGDPPSKHHCLALASTARRRDRSSAVAKPDQVAAAYEIIIIIKHHATDHERGAAAKAIGTMTALDNGTYMGGRAKCQRT